MKIHIADAGRKVVGLHYGGGFYLPVYNNPNKVIIIDSNGDACVMDARYEDFLGNPNYQRVYEKQAVTLTF